MGAAFASSVGTAVGGAGFGFLMAYALVGGAYRLGFRRAVLRERARAASRVSL